MLKFMTFAVLVALVAAQRPGLGETLFGAPEPELFDSQDELREMARHVVEGDASEVCDNEVEFYKWFPPLPCRVENSTFDALAERQCPEDGQCNIGPVDTTLNTTAVRTFFCSRPGKYMLYQACRIRNVETGEEREASECASYDGKPVACTVGPFAVLSNNTDYMVYYCDTTMSDSLKEVAARGVVSQACRIENHYGDDLLRRRCPHGFVCSKGPMEGSYNNKEVSAYLCEEHEEEHDGIDMENWNKTLSETVHYLVVEKEVDPFVILMVMRNLSDHNHEVSARNVLHKVHEVMMAKAEREEHEEDHHEKKKDDEKENPMEVMHQLHHMSLLSMQAKLHEMVEEKGEEDEDSMAMMLKMMMKQHDDEDEDDIDYDLINALMGKKQEKDEDKDITDLIKAMMGKKQEQDEDKDITDLIKALMGKKQDEEEDKDITDLIKALMGMQQEKKMSKADQVKSVFKKVAFVKALGEKVEMIEKSSGDDEAKLVKLMQAVHHMLEENESIMEGVSGPMKVMKVVKAVMYVKNNFEGAMEEADEDVKWMLVIAKKLKEQKAEEEDEDHKDLVKLLMHLHGNKEEMSKEESTKMFFKKMAFVKQLGEKVMKIEEMAGDEEMKLAKVLQVVHEMLEENEDIMKGEDGIKKVMKVMKALKYVKTNFEGAEEEEDEDVKWMLVIAKKLMEQGEKSDEADLKMYFKKVAFVKAVGEKVNEIDQSGEDEGAKLVMLLGALHKMVEEHGDIIEGKDGLTKVVKVMRAVKYVKSNFKGAEEEEDEDVKWMIMIAKKLMEEYEEEEEDKNPLMKLLKMLMGQKEDEEDRERDPLKMLMKMLKGKKGGDEEDRERDPLKMLMKMLKGEREEDEEDRERDPLKMLMKMLMGMKEGDKEDEDEKGGMLKEILSSLKELSEKNNEADREGMQILAFVKSLMGGEGGENLQDIMHHLHHLHLLKAEKEMKEKYEEKSQQMEAESKAQELLKYMHQTMQGQMGGGYGPPMGGRW